MSVTTKSFGIASQLGWAAEVMPLVPLGLAAALALSLGCIQGIVGRRREGALSIAHGASRRRVVCRNVSVSSVTAAGSGLLGLLLSLPVLAGYNGLAQFGRFVGLSVVGIGLVALLAGVVVASTSLVNVRTSLPAALANIRPLRRLSLVGTVAHSLCTAVVLIVLALASTYAGAALANRKDAGLWHEAAALTALDFRLSNSEFEGIEQRTARIGKSTLVAGMALVSRGAVGPVQGNGPDGGNSLIVNDRYLREQRIDTISGQRLDASSIASDALTLLVPDDLADDSSTIATEFAQWLQFQAEVDGHAPKTEVPTDIVPIRSGQKLFNYSTSEPTSTQVDAVVAVLPTTTQVLSDDWIASEMTTGGILFSDKKALKADLKAAGLESSVVITPVSELAAVRLADQEKTARANIFAGVLAAVVLVLAAVVTATSIAERNRRSDFVRYVHGGRRLKTILLPTAVVAVLGSASLGLAGAAHLFPTAASLALAGGVVAADIVTVAVLLAVQRRRFHADTIKKS